MADVDDAHGLTGQLDREDHNIRTADIDDADREAILAFADHRRFNRDLSDSTVVSDMSTLRRSAERAPVPLVEFDGVAHVTELLKTNRTAFEVSEGSNRNYRRALRVFYHWLDDREGGYEWWDDIVIPTVDVEPLDPNDVLSVDEVTALRQAAGHPREKALVEFLADTGLRITAALQLKRKGIEGLDGPHPTFTPNRDGKGQKGIDTLPLPIIQGQQYLRIWLNDYHPEDHPEAPVFCVKDYFHRDRRDTAISTSRARDQLKDLAEQAGLERERIHPHAFRHVATTRMRRDMGMDWDDIAHRTGWSSHALDRMKQLYGHLTNEDRNDRVFETVGRGSEGEDDQPVFVTCGNCKREISADGRFCPGCGSDQEAEHVGPEVRRLLTRLREDTAAELNDELDRLEADPEGRAAFNEPVD